MKKTFKLLALAAISMMVAVACNNAPEATEDTTAIDTPAVEEMVEDTVAVIDTVAEEPVVETPAKPTKKPAKKQETKKTSASEQSIDNAHTGTGTISVNKKDNSKNATGAAEKSLDNNANKGAGSISLKKK